MIDLCDQRVLFLSYNIYHTQVQMQLKGNYVIGARGKNIQFCSALQKWQEMKPDGVRKLN